MSTGLPELARSNSLLNLLRRVGSFLIVLALVVVGFWGSHFVVPQHEADVDTDTSDGDVETEVSTQVTLPPEKYAAAGIHSTQVALADLQQTNTVAGRIDYDANRRLEMTTPVECIIKQWHVTPGQVVAQGEVLATLASPEVALARTEIQKCAADVRVARIDTARPLQH